MFYLNNMDTTNRFLNDLAYNAPNIARAQESVDSINLFIRHFVIDARRNLVILGQQVPRKAFCQRIQSLKLRSKGFLPQKPHCLVNPKDLPPACIRPAGISSPCCRALGDM